MVLIGVLGYVGVVAWLSWVWSRTPQPIKASVPKRQRAIVVWTVCAAGAAWLVGLLLTVRGLVVSFEAVSHVDPAHKAEQLSEGISQAMNWTAGGVVALILGAIVAVVAGVKLIRKAAVPVVAE